MFNLSLRDLYCDSRCWLLVDVSERTGLNISTVYFFILGKGQGKLTKKKIIFLSYIEMKQKNKYPLNVIN